MGKNRVIRIIADVIAGLVAHKILLKYSNKPESINHLKSEIDNYRGIVIEYMEEFNWNIYDREKIKNNAIKTIKIELKKPHFHDVKFPVSEIDKLTNETIKEFLG